MQIYISIIQLLKKINNKLPNLLLNHFINFFVLRFYKLFKVNKFWSNYFFPLQNLKKFLNILY